MLNSPPVIRRLPIIVTLSLTLMPDAGALYAAPPPGKTPGKPSAKVSQAGKTASCPPSTLLASSALNASELPDDGPRYDKFHQGPDLPLFEQVLGAYRCQDSGAAEAGMRALAQQFPASPLLPAARAFLAELVAAGRPSPAEPRNQPSQAPLHLQGLLDAIEAYRTVIRDFPESPNAVRAQWRIGDLFAQMGTRAEARAAYERVLSAVTSGYDADRALLGMAVNDAAWGRGRDAEQGFALLRKRTDNDKILRQATVLLADALYARRQLREAQPLYEAAYRRWPAFVKQRRESLLRFAEAESLVGSEVLSRQLLTAYANLYPQAPDAPVLLVRIGDSFRAAGERGRAGMFYSAAVERYPGTEGEAAARMRLAELGREVMSTEKEQSLTLAVQALVRRNGSPNLDEAEQRRVLRDVAEANQTVPLGSEALYHLGEHFEAGRRWADAVRTYRAAIARHGRLQDDVWPEAAAHRLFVLLSPMFLEAIQSRDATLVVALYRQFDPFSERLFQASPMLLSIADAHREIGLVTEAVKLYQALLETQSLKAVHEGALVGLGRSYLDQEDFKAARQVFGRYALQYPLGRWKAEALRFRAVAYKGEGESQAVIRTCREWLQRYPAHGDRREVLLMLADALQATGQPVELLGVYEALEADSPRAASETRLRHGDLLVQLKRYDDALAQYRQAVEAAAEPEQAQWARIQMALILRAQKRYADARLVLKELEAEHPDEWIGRLSQAMRDDLQNEPANEGG